MRAAFIVFLLIPAIALAEPVLPPQPPSTQAAPAHAANCDAWYPAAQAQANYTSLLNVHIAPDGMIRDAAPAVTSGNADIDNAALRAPRISSFVST